MFKRCKKLSPGRALVSDIVTIANKMPMAPVIRTLDLSELDELRRQVRPRISWTIVMMKAYANVAIKKPVLRQIFASIPFPYIYEHPNNVCMATITREVDNESVLYFARFNRPENYDLVTLQKKYESFRRTPISEIKQFRHQTRFAKCPYLIRKLLWGLMNKAWPSSRAQHLGTFGMSLSGYGEAHGYFHLGPSTTVLGYELFPKKGQCRISITFDHRLIDGKPVVDVIENLHQELIGSIRDELYNLALSTNPDFAKRASAVCNDEENNESTLRVRAA